MTLLLRRVPDGHASMGSSLFCIEKLTNCYDLWMMAMIQARGSKSRDLKTGHVNRCRHGLWRQCTTLSLSAGFRFEMWVRFIFQQQRSSYLETTLLRAWILVLVRLVTGILIHWAGPRQNGRDFADDIFKCIFVKENVWISLKISLKFVHKVRINNILALIQTMAWRRPGVKPLSEPMTLKLLTHICVTRPQCVNIRMKQNISMLRKLL